MRGNGALGSDRTFGAGVAACCRAMPGGNVIHYGVPAIITNGAHRRGRMRRRASLSRRRQCDGNGGRKPSASRSRSASRRASSRVGYGPTNTRKSPPACRTFASTPSGASWFARCATKFCALRDSSQNAPSCTTKPPSAGATGHRRARIGRRLARRRRRGGRRRDRRQRRGRHEHASRRE